ncbi:hypothetical protein DWB77_04262 [Streptomyces hundungensis]|uniref:Uncharacterized protein n=1 Tax=Streptomyces hundungensis TaxID=1077946 RepID=A0A387HMM0_9ACTN|nr:hypothetical protein DWB77_04262 [Streptomyces hundungensis]
MRTTRPRTLHTAVHSILFSAQSLTVSSGCDSARCDRRGIADSSGFTEHEESAALSSQENVNRLGLRS